MTVPRTARIERRTAETDITLRLDLDGRGESRIATGVGFFDHMLTALARHAGFDMELTAKGDLEVDAHHTVEDVGIVLGQAIAQAMGDKRGITRFGHALVPMDEALVEAALDCSGRGFLVFDIAFPSPRLGAMDTELVEEFFRALAHNAGITLHLRARSGRNSHHLAEAAFKAAARALRMALALDPRTEGRIPSTKEAL
jgi:imidazoleglycerol-phosphate dehydratase